ncbi:uncharacterized protein LOC101238824 [Hydra vulgaris]|uniref:uncharacterized protein LOC101238824 n=1 Tax=Hydra vulgaris TaxID=6087 RepID=UPI001F5EF8DA|nr:uncharacterized protein LOC101238824 [Hydra vulgaris]XP_047146591.1 uncharacterized protein LOC101238824 [Hydra vulgaris]
MEKVKWSQYKQYKRKLKLLKQEYIKYNHKNKQKEEIKEKLKMINKKPKNEEVKSSIIRSLESDKLITYNKKKHKDDFSDTYHSSHTSPILHHQEHHQEHNSKKYPEQNSFNSNKSHVDQNFILNKQVFLYPENVIPDTKDSGVTAEVSSTSNTHEIRCDLISKSKQIKEFTNDVNHILAVVKLLINKRPKLEKDLVLAFEEILHDQSRDFMNQMRDTYDTF